MRAREKAEKDTERETRGEEGISWWPLEYQKRKRKTGLNGWPRNSVYHQWSDIYKSSGECLVEKQGRGRAGGEEEEKVGVGVGNTLRGQGEEIWWRTPPSHSHHSRPLSYFSRVKESSFNGRNWEVSTSNLGTLLSFFCCPRRVVVVGTPNCLWAHLRDLSRTFVEMLF